MFQQLRTVQLSKAVLDYGPKESIRLTGQTDRQKETDRDRETETERQRETATDRQTGMQTDRETEVVFTYIYR